MFRCMLIWSHSYIPWFLWSRVPTFLDLYEIYENKKSDLVCSLHRFTIKLDATESMVRVQSSDSCSPGVFADSHLYTVMISQLFKLPSTALGTFYHYKTSMLKKVIVREPLVMLVSTVLQASIL